MGIYQNLFELIQTYIYGGVTLTADMNLVCTLLSTIGSVFVVALPFCIVWKVISFITGR